MKRLVLESGSEGLCSEFELIVAKNSSAEGRKDLFLFWILPLDRFLESPSCEITSSDLSRTEKAV